MSTPPRIIPIQQAEAAPVDLPDQPLPPDGPLRDRYGRTPGDLRISVTDRCNFRCTYCMPRSVFGPDYPYLPRQALLSFEEITRVARIARSVGVRKIRITGGEPLLRKDLVELIAMLHQLGGLELTLTTNAVLLARFAPALRDAGLRRVTVSLDALDDTVFRRMNDADFPVARVLEGIDAASAAGLAPIKINTVVKRGVNDDQILPLVEHFRHSGHVLRFIEFMDVGTTNGWKLDEVLPSAEVIARIHARHPVSPLERSSPGEVAERWAFDDGGGEIGVISSITQPFCQGCNRMRLSTDGKLYTCLFADRGHDLRTLIRNGADDDRIARALSGIWQDRTDRYSALRSAATPGCRPRIEMSYIGG